MMLWIRKQKSEFYKQNNTVLKPNFKSHLPKVVSYFTLIGWLLQMRWTWSAIRATRVTRTTTAPPVTAESPCLPAASHSPRWISSRYLPNILCFKGIGLVDTFYPKSLAGLYVLIQVTLATRALTGIGTLLCCHRCRHFSQGQQHPRLGITNRSTLILRGLGGMEYPST